MRLSSTPRLSEEPALWMIGESLLTRSIRAAEVCPRGVSAKEHRLGHYYHVRNRSSLACIADIMPREELYAMIGRWEPA